MFKRKHKNKHERMRDFFVRAFKKKVMIAKWQLNLFGLVCFFVGSVFGVYLVVSKKFPAIFAADQPTAFTMPIVDPNSDADSVLFSKGTLSGAAISGDGASEKLEIARDLSSPGSNANYQSDVANTPGLISYWKMDGTMRDATGNRNMLSPSSDPLLGDPGKLGRSIYFDGSGDFVFTNDGDYINTGNNFSFCTWFKTSETQGNILASNGVTGLVNSYSLVVDNGKLRGNFWPDNSGALYAESTSSVNDNNWHYGCQTVDSTPGNSVSTVRIYIDGVLEGSNDSVIVAQSSSSYALMLGTININGDDHMFKGYLDELTTFNKTLSGSEISALYSDGMNGVEGVSDSNLLPNLMFGYHFNEEAGGNSDPDFSGKLLPAYWNSYYNAGKYVKGRSFWGSYTCADFDEKLQTPNFSIEMWINPSDSQNQYADIIDRQHGTSGWVLQRRDDVGGNAYSLQWWHPWYGFRGNDSYVTLTSNEWQHLVVTKKVVGGEVFITYYINGNQVAQSYDVLGLADFVPEDQNPICLGNYSLVRDFDNRKFNGELDEFAIYNRALNPGEIASHASSTYRTDLATWESQPMNIGWSTAWSAGNSFSANVDVPTGTTLSFEVRTANTTDELASATYLSAGSATEGASTYDFDMISNNIPIGTFVQIKATLVTIDQSVTPRVNSITLNHIKDATPPETLATDLKFEATRWDYWGAPYVVTLPNSGAWTNNMNLFFSWNNAADSQAGIKGYCLYLGNDQSGDPQTQGGFLADSRTDNASGSYSYWPLPESLIDSRTVNGKCHFILKNNDSGRTKLDLAGDVVNYYGLNSNGNIIWSVPSSNQPYYLNIRAIDNNNNLSEIQSFQFGYDDNYPKKIGYISMPGNFVSNKDVTITWPIAPDPQASNDQACNNYTGDANSDSEGCACTTFDSNGKCTAWDYSPERSGIAGFQYRVRDLNGNGTWYGLKHTGTGGLEDLIPANQGSYTFQSEFLDENGNPIYVKDQDGNPTSEINSDFRSLNEGVNTIELRICDNAGNCEESSSARGQLKINTLAPSVPEQLTVTPNDATVNSYAFTWKKPDTFIGSDATKLKYCYTVNTLPNENSCIFTPAGVTSLPADAFANQPGENTFYLVAMDEAGNINYDVYASVKFTYSGSAPGIPKSVDVADISIKETENWKLVASWDQPDQIGAGVDKYKIFRSEAPANCAVTPSAFSEVGTTAGTSFSDTNLSQKEYFYCVRACDSANNCSAASATVSKLPTGKYTKPANLLDEPKVSAVSTSKATIDWVTDRNSDSKVAYGKEAGKYYEEEPSNSKQTKTHNITLNNLSPGTQYYYRTKWTDEDGNTGISEEKSFTTQPAPVVKDVEVKNIGISSAFIKFTTKGASEVKIYYGRSTGFGGIRKISTSDRESSYTVQLDSLNDGTKHYYKINTFDSEGTEYEGTTLDFTTLPRPKVSNVKVEDVRNTAQPEILVTWETNTETSSIVTYYPKGEKDKAHDEVNVKLVSGAHKLNIKNLLPEKEYVLVVKGVDKIGNEASSDEYSFTTASDTRPPMVSDLNIEGVITDNVNQKDPTAQLVVSWNTDEPATSQIEYGEGSGSDYAQKTQEDLNLTTNHLVIVSGLAPSKVYHLRVVSEDKASNRTNSIDNVTITPKAVDNALDLVIINLQEIFGFLANLRN